MLRGLVTVTVTVVISLLPDSICCGLAIGNDHFMSCLRYLCLVSNAYCAVLCFVFLRLVYPMLSISLDCPFVLPLSVFSNPYLVGLVGYVLFFY